MIFNGTFALIRAKAAPGLGGGGLTDGRMDGHPEIHPCVLQDIGPLGPLPKKKKNTGNDDGKQQKENKQHCQEK